MSGDFRLVRLVADKEVNLICSMGVFYLRIFINLEKLLSSNHHRRCHCTLINQILRIQGILGRFCTLNYNISTGNTRQCSVPLERFQIASARVRSDSRFAPSPSSDMA